MLAILDYGIGNLNSILNLCVRLRVQACVSSRPHEIEAAAALILPGVGNFAQGIKNLRESGLIPLLEKQVIERKIPLLGLCLGMQLLAKSSEEGNAPGLGWIDAEVVRFRFERTSPRLRVPHVGFNTIRRYESPLFACLEADARFYFSHSYHLMCRNRKNVIATTEHGYEFPSIVQSNNIFGTQFHPEKSHQSGLQLVKGFIKVAGLC